MNDRDKESGERREASRLQLNTVLGKHGWKLDSVKMPAPAVVEYRLVRTDGRTITHRMLLSDLLMVGLGEGDAELGVNLMLALQLLVVVKRENAKNPIVGAE